MEQRVILQNFIMPVPGTCTEKELYFRTEGRVEYILGEAKLLLHRQGSVYFDTYFNSLPVGQWRRYARVGETGILLRFRGRIRLSVLHKKWTQKGAVSRILGEYELASQGEEVYVPIPDGSREGIYSVDLKALEKTLFLGACFTAKVEGLRPVKLALDICTYKREKYVLENLGKLGKALTEDPRYRAMHGQAEVFVIDNGGTLEDVLGAGILDAGTLDAGTLDADILDASCILDGPEPEAPSLRGLPEGVFRLFPNRNLGGTGGFTRGLMEILRSREKGGYTHALLMDDDIVLDPETLYRTWMLLGLVKEEYKEAFVGGAMLRLDYPWLQTESGALWGQGELAARKSGLDLRQVESCLFNQVEETVEYNAWWYCAMPLSAIGEEDLPMPLFIRGDDVEYGLRHGGAVMLMNGICVWHEPFERKYSSAMFYYILRNRLIDNALHGRSQSLGEVRRMVRHQVEDEVRLYRYRNARLLMEGAEDFLKGTGWLERQDGEVLHGKIQGEGYRMEALEKLGEGFSYTQYEASVKALPKAGLMSRIVSHYTVNGTYLRPRKGYGIVPVTGPVQSQVYRVERVLNYDPESGKGFVTQRDPRQARECMRDLRRLCRRLGKEYAGAVEDYRENYRRLTGWEFWEKYLGLEKGNPGQKS